MNKHRNRGGASASHFLWSVGMLLLISATACGGKQRQETEESGEQETRLIPIESCLGESDSTEDVYVTRTDGWSCKRQKRYQKEHIFDGTPSKTRTHRAIYQMVCRTLLGKANFGRVVDYKMPSRGCSRYCQSGPPIHGFDEHQYCGEVCGKKMEVSFVGLRCTPSDP
jgi:hypothetical protein